MPTQTNYRVIIGIMIVLEAYILLNSSLERHYFQSNIVAFIQMLIAQQFEYFMIALMYTSGVALIFNVGNKLILVYCYFRCILEGFCLMTGVAFWRSVLLMAVYLGFVMIISRFQDEQQKIASQYQNTVKQKDTEKAQSFDEKKQEASNSQGQ